MRNDQNTFVKIHPTNILTMNQLRLNRGIAVPESKVDTIIETIKTNGLNTNEGSQWGGFAWKNLRSNLIDLYEKEDLTREDTSPASRWISTPKGGYREYTEGENGICLADTIGAKYYATKHNKNDEHNTSILITLDINIENIAIDGRDLLYTVFGFINPNDSNKTKKQTELLKKLFGNKIELYVEKLIKHPQSNALAICDLAIVDDEIIFAHYKNDLIIGGRGGTKFKSAFWGKTPITPENIIRVERLNKTVIDPYPDITLNHMK